MKSLPIKFLFTYAVQETSRRKCYYILSFICCFLVALTTLIVNSLLSQSPIIFLIIAQNDVGEMDIKIDKTEMTTKVQNSLEDFRQFNSFLNFSSYQTRVKNYGLNLPSAPRIDFQGFASDKESNFTSTVQVTLINTELEKEMSLGKNYNYSKLGRGQCNVHGSLTDQLEIDIGENIYLQLDITNYFKNIFIENVNRLSNNSINFTKISPILVTFPCLVQNILPNSMGKVDKDIRKIVFMELDYFFNYTANFIAVNLTYPEMVYYLQNIKLQDHSSQIIANFPSPRPTTYLESNYNELLKKSSEKANLLVKAFGKDFNVAITLPIVAALKMFANGAVFLGLILYLTIFILFLLSVILIYSLLTITLETSSLELGILRLIGTDKTSVIWIVLMQCLLFSVPAFILAFVIQFPIFAGVSNVLRNLSSSDVEINASVGAIFLSLFLTNLAPLLASIVPVKDILSKNLSAALNTKMSKTSGMKIEIVSIKEEQQNALLIFGILTFLYGVSIYYFLPLALLSFNLGLLLTIFLLILIGMLIGFMLLSLNLENLVQKFFTYLFFFWNKSYFLDILFKNLSAHKVRNRKTSLMYCLSVGFFILITVGYNNQTASQKFQRLSMRGAYISVLTDDYLTPKLLNNSLRILTEKKLIEDYSFMTPSLNLVNNKIGKLAVANEGKSFTVNVNLNGVGFNLFNTTVNDFLMIEQQKEKYKMDLSETLYLKNMRGKIGMSGYFRYFLDLGLEDKFFLEIDDKDSNKMQLLFESAYFVKSAPSLQMSNQPSMMARRDVIIPMNIYLDLLKKCEYFFNADKTNLPSFPYSEIPITQILLKVPEKIPRERFNDIYDIFDNDPDVNVRIWSYQEYANNIDNTNNMINFLFGFVNIIVFIFCFFNLSASMSINIMEQTKEITIYRALGVPKNYLIFIYIAEAFVLILSSSFVGLIIGTILSWTMTLQRVLFTNLPLTFSFPTGQLIAIFIASVLGSFICTIFPARNILNREIAEIMKLG